MLCYKFDKLEREKILDALSLVIYGDFGNNSKPIKPIKTKAICSCKFAVGEVVSFHLKNMDMGDLYKLKLVQAHPGQSTRWYLKSFEVRCDKNKYSFFYNKWIASSRAEKKPIEIKLYEKDYKIKRTVSTLSHRLLKGYDQEELYEESFDDSDTDGKAAKSSKLVKKKSNMDKYDRDDEGKVRERRDRERGRGRERSRRHSGDEWDDYDDDAESWGSSSRSRSAKDRSLERKDKLRLRLSDHDLRRGGEEREDKFLKKYTKYTESNRSRSPSPGNKRPGKGNKYDGDEFEDDYDNKLKDQRFQRRQPSESVPVDDKHFLGKDAVIRRDKEMDDNYKQRMRMRQANSLNTISEADAGA